MNDQKPENLKRRGFLLAASVGGAGAVAAVAVGVGKEAAEPGDHRQRRGKSRRLRRDPPHQQLLPHGAGLIGRRRC